MLFANSRYRTTPVTYSSKKQSLFFRTRRKGVFNKNEMIKHTIVQGDNLPVLAKKYYDNASYYWVIMDANAGKIQSEFDLKLGDIIDIPSYEQVVRLFE